MVRKRHTVIVALVAAVCTLAFVGVNKSDVKSEKYTKAQIERGKYLVNAVGSCNDCHTPHIMTPEGPAPDMTRLLSGAPSDEKVPDIPDGVVGPGQWTMLATNDMTTFAGPWGVSFAANLTPDKTGIGGWTEKMFVNSLRNGKYWGNGRTLLPPMPWQAMRNMSDNDLRDVFAYLKSVKPVKNVVPAPIPPKH